MADASVALAMQERFAQNVHRPNSEPIVLKAAIG